MQQLNQDIKEKQFKKAYLLFGEEGFLIKSYKNKLMQAILDGDSMNLHTFAGKGMDVGEIISLAETMPFFAERRLIVMEDSGLFKSGGEELVDYLPAMPDTTTLLFTETQVDKRSRLYKAVKKIGCAAELGRQDEKALTAWVLNRLGREGKQITAATMGLFLHTVGSDMENIRTELDKLIAYTLGRETITAQDVKAVCTEQVTNQIFEMVSAISGRNPKKALDLYEDLLTLREPPMRILFLIARQFNQILQVKDLARGGLGKGEIAAKLKLPPFVVGKILLQAKTFSKEQILSYVELCVDMEQRIKQGRLADKLAVEMLITNKY